jgi:hypothetical protein
MIEKRNKMVDLIEELEGTGKGASYQRLCWLDNEGGYHK